MLNIKLIRKQLKYTQNQLKIRGFNLDINFIKKIEKKRKNLKNKTELLQYIRNQSTQKISIYLKKKKSIQSLKQKVIIINKKLIFFKNELNKIQNNLLEFYMHIPNIPDFTVPYGNNESYNVEILKWGKIKQFNFPIKDHITLGKKIKGLHWNTGSKIAGSRFVVMSNKIALLHRALGQFMLDTHINQHNYIEMNVPYIVNAESLYGTGQLPKFENELFCLSDTHNIHVNKYFLIPTAEVPLINIFRKKNIIHEQLPIKLTALSACFRSESNSYGLDTKGLIRMHQFDKVELIQIVEPENSHQSLEILTKEAEKILQLLHLPYRKILLCAGDLSFASSKTYDLEVWFPSQNRYLEVSSCSNMKEFQSRRISLKKYSFIKNKKYRTFLHTLNGSGLAIGRILAAILENNQTSDGKILIPKILRKKYMHNLKYLF
ncbi:serine--tRNA ligase [Buchnera aphidicola (Thelaxes californica)]|uniref:Serine--tRNA ligase n=1 Tax=Buchnera aphidicola (Thelaxes californica) TaxID=1315998 RepID=A0A4D6YLC6_9GAMM|nr:serine--tRNA ligase [Buchnera aphidicola]QCI26774.1 serine--tRNA ligase [Buchnera aphidicola (Thelaxes californica)]